ncbi:unnamed protein product [Brachionus calyciflorus]|uniref:FLYWCH-type domain-containing protein n=1 Tax=Brachionus calyciflorus TaxID=104777 RepID=A0A814H5E5_9BILA|nr:unnamed protein product [Brachionus calyciflorus]
MQNIKLVPSSHGKSMILVDKFLFIKWTRRDNGSVYWKCIHQYKYKCKASLTSSSLNTDFISSNSIHTEHPEFNSLDVRFGEERLVDMTTYEDWMNQVLPKTTSKLQALEYGSTPNEININDAIFKIKSAWDKVGPIIVANCQKAGSLMFKPSETVEVEDNCDLNLRLDLNQFAYDTSSIKIHQPRYNRNFEINNVGHEQLDIPQ